MLYFIPAWYQQDDWKESEEVWYRSRTVTEFDDTVKQIQLFFRKHVAPFRILTLGFSPNFRHFLHRQGVYHAPYWSCFDAMQGITAEDMQVFSFHDLTWPEDVSFVYSPFAVIVNRGEEQYAQVEFAEDGNMFRVDMYESDQLTGRNYYDDRGFLSCMVACENGVPFREQYFDDHGVWKFARYLRDGHVVVNPESSWYLLRGQSGERKIPYQKQQYDSIDQMIAEVLRAFLEETSSTDILAVAMDPVHSGVLAETLRGHRIILSFFDRRMREHGAEAADRELLEAADYVVADNEETVKKVERTAGRIKAPLAVITPYDSRVDHGISEQLHVQKILLAVDQMEEDVFNRTVAALARYASEKNKRARVCLFTRSSVYNERHNLMARTQKALQEAGLDPELAMETTGKSESDLDDDRRVPCVFSVEQCVDEMTVNRVLREQRVLVDYREDPDQFLQISAMSMGIPQITSRETTYVADGENGRVIHHVKDLTDAVDYYLGSIENYNEAKIASYRIGSRFTTDELVKSWEEVIRNVEHQSTSAGK